MMRVDGAWKPAEAVRDPRAPIWPSATSIQGFLPELRRFQDDFRPEISNRSDEVNTAGPLTYVFTAAASHSAVSSGILDRSASIMGTY